MEQQNKFFVFDAYVFAFKNALANVRVITLALLSWIAITIPIVVITYIMAGKNLMAQFMIAKQTGTLITWPLLLLQYLRSNIGIILITLLLFFLLITWLVVGIIRISYRIHDTGKADLADFFPSPWIIIKTLIGMILMLLGFFVGAILLVFPGIYFVIRSWFCLYALAEGEGVFEAFATSFRLTRGYGWQVLGLWIAATWVGMITIWLGLLIDFLAGVYAYRLLQKSAH